MVFSFYVILDTYFGLISLLLGVGRPVGSWKLPKEEFKLNPLRYRARHCTIAHCRKRKSSSFCVALQHNHVHYSALSFWQVTSGAIAQPLRYCATTITAVNGLRPNFDKRDLWTIKNNT